MRQNFVLKKNEENGKIIAASVFWILAVIELILFFVAISNGGAEAGFGFMIFVLIFEAIAFILEFSIKKEYHGYFAMEGFTIECRTTKYFVFKGFEWDVRVNDVPLPLNGNKKQQYLDYTCTINGSHSMIVKVIGTRVRPLSPVITIDGIPVVENDLVYVDKIKQILNI